MTEADIRAVIAEQERAMRSRDAAALIARYTQDVVKFDLAPPLGRSGAAARDVEGLRAWFAGFDGEIDFAVTRLSVEVAGDLAFCHSVNRLGATPKGAPGPFTMWFRSTLCLRRDGSEWLVAHEHTSTPFHMDGSFRAATDLLPDEALSGESA
ncbi:nuclear transport factor 2 family protein [Actinokineospora sp. NBRC 105648]|uniref:YybH family protein n=1 Tax=Actinokineospora sp. NBRC 105648 TaxID=3032206 RepID=UPI0024A099D1|nr:nuclear transport factor 2 family protein [Actinokineospora sp. NBRC 105648]GLZ39627.1 ketosteroid isomerase [Actinokineospora sp. NBRC 105648]